MTKVFRSLIELREVRARLDSHGHPAFKLSPLGVIRSTLCGYWAYEAVVDQWPDFKALILRPNKERVQEFDFEFRDVYCYGLCPESMEKLLQTPDLLPWKETFSIPVCNVELRDVLKRAAQQHGGSLQYTDEKYEVYVPRDVQAIKDFNMKSSKTLPIGMSLGPLRQEHAQEVVRDWTSSRKTDDTEYWVQYIGACAKYMWSSCAFAQDGELVATSGTYMDGTFGLSYTNPKFRGKHIGSLLMNETVSKILQGNVDFVGYAGISNSIAKSALEAFYRNLEGVVCFLHYKHKVISKL